MGSMIKVGMADLNICQAPDAITTLGLGSCVGVALYDKTTKKGGLLHAMLPDSTQIKNNSNRSKFVDTGMEDLIKKLEMQGVKRSNLTAKMAGGARMFALSTSSAIGNVGERNVAAAKEALKKYGIRLIAEDTGLDYGRTVELHCETGEFYIKSVGKPLKII